MLTNSRVWQASSLKDGETSHSRFSLSLPVSHARRPMILFDANYPKQGFEPPPALKIKNNIRAGRLAARTGILD